MAAIETIGDLRATPDAAQVEGVWEIDHPEHRGDVVVLKLGADGMLTGAYLPLKSRVRFDVETGTGEVRGHGAARFLNVTRVRWCGEACDGPAVRQPVLFWRIERATPEEIELSAPRLQAFETWIRDGRLPGLPCRQAFPESMANDDQWCLGHLDAVHLDLITSPDGLDALFGASRTTLRRLHGRLKP